MEGDHLRERQDLAMETATIPETAAAETKTATPIPAEPEHLTGTGVAQIGHTIEIDPSASKTDCRN